MIKLYMLLLAGCALYLSGADGESNPRRDQLRELGKKTSDLSGLSDVMEAYQVYGHLVENQVDKGLIKKQDSLPVVNTEDDGKEVVTARKKLLKLATENLRNRRKDTGEIMRLAEPLESALETYRSSHRRKDASQEGPSPRTICLWGEIRAVEDHERYHDNIFFQFAKGKLKENRDVQSRRDQLVQLSKDALNAKYDEMALMIMRVAVAFDKGTYDEQMSDEVIDDLFSKAAANKLEIGKEFSPRTEEMFKQIHLTQDTRKALLAWLF